MGMFNGMTQFNQGAIFEGAKKVYFGDKNYTYVTLRSPDSLTSGDYDLIFPTLPGDVGEVLRKSSTTGQLEWVLPAKLLSKETIVIEKDCLASGANCDSLQDGYSPLCPDGYDFDGGSCSCPDGLALEESMSACFLRSKETSLVNYTCNSGPSNFYFAGKAYTSDVNTGGTMKINTSPTNRWWCQCGKEPVFYGITRTICSRNVDEL